MAVETGPVDPWMDTHWLAPSQGMAEGWMKGLKFVVDEERSQLLHKASVPTARRQQNSK